MSNSVPPYQPMAPAASSSRAWEVLCHLSSAAGYIGVPFGHLLGPLIVWLIKRHDSPGVDAHGKESLNFQLSWTLYWLVLTVTATMLIFVVVGIFMWMALIPLFIIGWLSMVILVIVATIKASNGVLYRYPLTIRFLK